MPPLAGVYALVAAKGHHWPHALLLTWYAVLVCALHELARARKWRLRGRLNGIVLVFASLHLFVLTPEVALRLAAFRYEPGVGYHGDTHPSRFVRLVEDPGLFWTLPPGSPGVNAQGFKTRPLPRPVDPGLVRVVVLGDSVAFQGYPEIAETLLNARRATPARPYRGRRYEVVNLSLAGYSSYQGRVVAERHGDAVAADVAVIGYGWNDHWLAWGEGDGEKADRAGRASRIGASPIVGAVYGHARLAQAARYLLARATPARDPGDALRVPPELFADNLRFLGDFWQARGARPLLLTLPSAHARLGVPAYLIAQGFARDEASVVELHAAYCRIVREVAAERGWPLLDLERQLADLAAEDLERIFTADGIHLTAAGLALFAERVAAAIAELDTP